MGFPLSASSRRAQGSTEYLVILGVVLVVALVSISMLGEVLDSSSDTQETESWLYWKGAASPFRVLYAATLPHSHLVCGNYSGGYRLEVQNSQAGTLTLDGLHVNNETAEICQMGANGTSAIVLEPGQQAVIDMGVETFPYYRAGQRVELDLLFNYDSQLIEGRAQHGGKKLVFRALDDNWLEVIQNGTGGSNGSGGNGTGEQNQTMCGAGCCHESEPCSGDSQCCGSMFCGQGACSKCKKRNEACASDSQCCSNAQFCSAGVCAQCRQRGEACMESSECCSNAQNCIAGVCSR